MKDLKYLYEFEKLLESANNPLVQQACAEGKHALAYTCYHMPEVLLNTGDCFSVRLRAPLTGSLDISSYYMSNFICDYCKSLLERGIERVVISLGGHGALYLRKGSTIYAEGLRVPVGSTVGAGDSVVAALAYAEAQGLSEEEAVRLSTAAGAANVMCSGTQAAEREAVEALLPKVRFSRLRP